jgi:hypothetical protein
VSIFAIGSTPDVAEGLRASDIGHGLDVAGHMCMHVCSVRSVPCSCMSDKFMKGEKKKSVEQMFLKQSVMS